MELNISEPIYDIPDNSFELCRALGIVLDNAIEELIDTDTFPKKLKFSIVDDETEKLFICTNAYRAEPPLRKIFREGYSTKGAGRGLGLTNLKKLCEENKILTYTVSLQDKQFTIKISIRQVRL